MRKKMKLFNDQEKETWFFASIKSHGTKISSQGSWNGAAHLRRPFFFFFGYFTWQQKIWILIPELPENFPLRNIFKEMEGVFFPWTVSDIHGLKEAIVAQLSKGQQRSQHNPLVRTERSRIKKHFTDWLIFLAKCPPGKSILWHMEIFSSFFRLMAQ